MIINFSNTLDEQRVQEMINESLSFTASVINLTNATAEQVKEAFANPDGILCLADYSGETFMEQYRRATSSGYIIFYYVPLAYAPDGYKIYDGLMRVTVNTSTGEVTSELRTYTYAPNIIYDLDRMNSSQLSVLSERINAARSTTTLRTNAGSFTAKWNYNGRQYVCIAGPGFYLAEGNALIGTSAILENRIPVIYYDLVVIDGPQVPLTHYEYTSNITLTPVTEGE